MKIVLVGLSLLLSSAVWAGTPSENERLYFQLENPEIQEVTTGPLANFQPEAANMADCNTAASDVLESGLDPANPIDEAHIWLDKIINLGKKAWSVVELGRPVVSIKMDSANALPQGIFCWNNLSGWSQPQSKTYRVSYKNGFNSEVVSFAFRVIYTAGGSYNGVGRYIANATIIPAELNVAWGFTFNARTVVPNVFNSGSIDKPVAGMQLDLNWSIDTVVKHIQQSESFYVGGDGAFKQMQ